MALDILVGGKPGGQEQPRREGGLTGRPYLGIQFVCAQGIYARLYRNEGGSAYEGRCPSCLKPVRVAIGSQGTDSRFFSYDCNRGV